MDNNNNYYYSQEEIQRIINKYEWSDNVTEEEKIKKAIALLDRFTK